MGVWESICIDMNLVTFCTPKYRPIYNKHARASIERVGITEHKHFDLLCEYSWLDATNKKPGIIREELSNGSVLYIDADAEIQSASVMDIDSIVPKKYVAACVFLDWGKWYGIKSKTIEPLTATLFFRQSAIPLVDSWIKLCERSADHDGINWAKAIADRDDVYELPLSWCYINDTPSGVKGRIPCDKPLIKQYQASRKMKLQ